MTDEERTRAMELRRARGFPRHSPPHFDSEGEAQYLISAACYEHASFIGKTAERMTECEAEVLDACRTFSGEIYAWCVLPNHYHVLILTESIKELLFALGQFHGRSSFNWNGEYDARGRKTWFNCFERKMKSERHFWVTLNYVLHNPVHHGYVERWQDWPGPMHASSWSRLDESRRSIFGESIQFWIMERRGISNFGGHVLGSEFKL